jgi:hypothetical protein
MPPKEDRSGWVAVESDCAVERVAIKAATSAFTYFQKHSYEQVWKPLMMQRTSS